MRLAVHSFARSATRLSPAVLCRSGFVLRVILQCILFHTPAYANCLQKSVVAVSTLPYIGLLKQVVRIVGPLLFAAEASGVTAAPVELLERAFDEARRWPALIPGTSVVLPLLSDVIVWQVPWTGLHNYRPNFIAPLFPASGPHRRRRAGSAGSLVSGATFSESFASLSSLEDAAAARPEVSAAGEGGGGATAADAADARGGDDDGGSSEIVTPRPTRILAGARHDGLPLQQPLPRHPAVSETAARPLGLTAGAADLSAAVLPAGDCSPRLGRPPTHILSLSEVFAASSLELAGLFQEVGLYSVFRGLSPCLWHLWELVITGQPVLVMGASPERCGDAVLALVSLISPLEFCADYRPYFTLFDPDFQQARGGGGEPSRWGGGCRRCWRSRTYRCTSHKLNNAPPHHHPCSSGGGDARGAQLAARGGGRGWREAAGTGAARSAASEGPAAAGCVCRRQGRKRRRLCRSPAAPPLRARPRPARPAAAARAAAHPRLHEPLLHQGAAVMAERSVAGRWQHRGGRRWGVGGREPRPQRERLVLRLLVRAHVLPDAQQGQQGGGVCATRGRLGWWWPVTCREGRAPPLSLLLLHLGRCCGGL